MAVREINLVPEDILNHMHVQRHLFFWSGCLVFLLVVFFGFHTYQTKSAMAHKRPLVNLKNADSELRTKIDTINKLQKELDRLKGQQRVFEKFIGRLSYSAVLLKLAHMLNEDTWLTSLSLEGGRVKGDEIVLKLTGFASRNEELGDFLNFLSSEPLFSKVLLKYAREIKKSRSGKSKEGQMDLVQFEIDCRIGIKGES